MWLSLNFTQQSRLIRHLTCAYLSSWYTRHIYFRFMPPQRHLRCVGFNSHIRNSILSGVSKQNIIFNHFPSVYVIYSIPFPYVYVYYILSTVTHGSTKHWRTGEVWKVACTRTCLTRVTFCTYQPVHAQVRASQRFSDASRGQVSQTSTKW